ncbi:S1C family serine protease [Gemmata sp.]|uniref:S1C family serine protease n=1 Tax=Gemmata sp. TaxID=1914242 RepID=UPI003F70543B
MTTRQITRSVAGCGMAVALLVAAAPNWAAADPKADTKWDTKRTAPPEDLDELKALQARVKALVDKCTPCTVAITIGFGAGSGVIVSEDGLVLTAAHVIAGEPKGGDKGGYEPNRDCTIILHDGKRVKAKTLGINDRADSGMVKIVDKGPKDGKWPFLPIAKSADVKPGQWVVSLGHPGGPKSGRAPVARLGQMENPDKHRIHTAGGFVVSNCTLVGGDSGGPLYDLDGNVIGIHSRIGLSLATNVHVPTDKFKEEWDKLVAGEVIGAKPKPVAAVVGVVFPEDENDDAWVAEVDEEGPAAKGGVKAGDTITKFNGEQVKTVKRFRELVKDRKPGDVVKLGLRRGTEALSVSVTLGKRGA